MAELRQELVNTQLQLIRLGEKLENHAVIFNYARLRLHKLKKREAILLKRLSEIKKTQDDERESIRIKLKIEQVIEGRSLREADFIECAIKYGRARQIYLTKFNKCESIKKQLTNKR